MSVGPFYMENFSGTGCTNIRPSFLSYDKRDRQMVVYVENESHIEIRDRVRADK